MNKHKSFALLISLVLLPFWYGNAQEKIINPSKSESQETFLDQLNKQTLTGQILSSRKSIQKDRKHLTPQGYVESYPQANQQENGPIY